MLQRVGDHAPDQLRARERARAVVDRDRAAVRRERGEAPAVADYRARLEARGFRVGSIALIPRPTPLPGHLRDWLEIFAASFISAVPLPDRPAFVDEVTETLRTALADADGKWTADYVRLRLSAVKPAG